MKFLHVTDSHLVAPGGRIYGLDPAERLRACVADILAEHADAAFCVITGDLAHRGEAAAYAALADITSSLPMPVHFLAGNHDDRATMRRCLVGVPTDANGFIQSSFDGGDGRFLILDTLDEGNPSGLYCERRQGWLRQALEAAGDRPVYLFMHHPPFAVGMPALDRIGVTNREVFADLLEGRSNIRHLFFGHAHRSISGSWRGIPVSTLCATIHQLSLDLRDVGRLRFTHERPCYGVVLIDDESVIVHLRDFLGPPPSPPE